ncbi:lipopolysaccharide assembly LapA domain-containing protein [Nocardia sp. NPDC051570]|uniref:lipopolysaccharide assembly LapA domain-containing protein n=1 Tax=Nocardia sp. NPDC051570 TaxID=3364324 RepID=UPI0037880AB7
MTSDAVPTPGPDPVSRASGDPIPPAPTGAPVPASPTQTKAPAKHSRPLRTRAGYTWTALVAAAILGIVLLIFILQNSDQVQTHLFFWDFTQPLGVTILLSVIAGALVMALVGGWRILQLRRAARKG